MATHHKVQHYVAKSYMEAWCDPEKPEGYDPYTWVFPMDGGEPKAKSPEKIFHEREMYTRRIIIPGVLDERDLTIEHGLSSLEDSFVRIRRDFLHPRREIPRAPKIKLLAFLVAQQWRTPRARRHLQEQWGGILERMDELKAAIDRMNSDEQERLRRPSPLSDPKAPSLGRDDVRALASSPLQELLIPYVERITPLLAKLTLTIFCASSRPGFITSDNPCIWFDPESHHRPPMYRGPALMYPSLEITMPLTPEHMLFLHRAGPGGYVEVSEELVDEVNRRTRAFADRSFISLSPTAKPFWYEEGEPPSPEDEDRPSY